MATAVCGGRGCGACMGIFGIFWDFLGGLLVRHVIPRGFACRSVEWLGRRCAVGVIMAIGAPIKNSIHSIHSILGIHSKRRPVDIANRNRYPAFFAKLFFTRKKSGGQRTRPPHGFFCQAFFLPKKKRTAIWLFC